MILKPDELSVLKPSPKPIQSKFKGTYKLVNITFTPLNSDPNQGDYLMSKVLMKMMFTRGTIFLKMVFMMLL
jgi:hypothetical protein